MRKTITFKSLICTIPLLLLFAGISFGQSFYKTYTTTNRPIKAKQTSNGYEIDLTGFKEYEVIRTDANGNFQSSSTYDYSNADNFNVGLRMSNGEYLMYKPDDIVGQMKYQVRDQYNNIKRAFSLFYPAGQKGAVGAMEEYADGTVFIAYSFGTGDFGNPQPRTIAYVKRNIYNDRNDMTGSIQTVGGVVNSPTGVEILSNGTIYMSILQDIGSFYQSYIAKINAAGNLVWRNQAASLERFIRNFTADEDGDIWHTYSQSFSNVVKRDNVTGNATSYFPDQFGFSGHDVDAIVPTRTGGIVMAAGRSNGELRTLKLNNDQVRLSNHTITAAQTNGSSKTPTDGIRNSSDEVVLIGRQGGNVFLMKLGKDGEWVSGGGNPGGGVDLTLSSNSSTPNPGVWQQMSLAVTVSNTGASTSTNVQVKVEIPTNDVVLNGGNPFTASQGDFQWWGNSVWTVGTLRPGESETLTLNFWNKNSSSKKVCAQVTSASGTDADSTPNNGANCRDSEDDETSFSFNGGGGIPTQLPDLWISDFQISNFIIKQGEVRNFTFDLNNTGDAAVQGNYAITAYMSTSQSNPGSIVVGNINTGNTALGTTQNVPGALTVPANLTPGTYYVHLVADANNQITEKNENNNRRVSRPIVVQASGGGALPDLTVRNVIPTASNVTIGQAVSVRFDNASIGATIPQSAFPITVTLYMSTDRNLSGNDYKILDLNVGYGPGINLGGQVPTNLPAGQYYLIVQTDTPNRLAEANENNNVGVSSSRVTASGNTGGGGAIDVSMTTNNTRPNQWGFFSVQLVAKNTGSSTANNVKVKFTKPAAVTYKGGDTHSASKGSFQWWGNNEWNIGSLGANQSATITVNYFRLSANSFTLTGSVTSGGGNDAASINFGNAANGVNNRSAIMNNMTEEPFAIVNAYPNPSTDYIDVAIYSNETKTSDLEIFSLTGKRIFGNQYELTEGLNEIRIETSDFPTGNYFIKMDPFHPYLRQLNFVVVRP